MKGRSAADAGLTLLELLVVLAILGMLATLASASLQSAVRGWRTLATHDAKRIEHRDGERWLRRLLSEIVPATTASNNPVVRFLGEPKQIEFLGPLSDRHGSRYIAHYMLALSNDRIEISWQLDRDPNNAASLPILDGVLEGFEDARLSYFGPAEPSGSKGTWEPRWDRRERLPLLIKLSFSAQGLPREIIVAPLLTGTVP